MSILLLVLAAVAATGLQEDRTAIALERCLASPAAAPAPVPDAQGMEDQPLDQPFSEEQIEEALAPTPPAFDGRSVCYDNARRAYDARIIRAYRSLLKRSEPGAAEWLAQTNQAWLTYREAASGDAEIVAAARDHALWLEGLRR